MPRERITSAMLGDAVAALNRELGREPGTPGAYGVLGAYGGYQLGTFAAAGAGSVDHVPLAVGHGYHSRRAVYDAVQAIRHGIQLGRQAGAPAGTVAVHVLRADANSLADALATAAERESSDAKFWEDDDDDDEAGHHRECVAALDRLADAIAAAVRQEEHAL